MSTAADLTVEQQGDVVVARIDGEIDRSNAEELGAALVKAVPNLAVALVLDLAKTTYIDSSGVQLLFDLASRLKKRQVQLRAAVASGAQIGRLLSVVAIERTVPLHATVKQAVAESRRESGPTG